MMEIFTLDIWDSLEQCSEPLAIGLAFDEVKKFAIIDLSTKKIKYKDLNSIEFFKDTITYAYIYNSGFKESWSSVEFDGKYTYTITKITLC